MTLRSKLRGAIPIYMSIAPIITPSNFFTRVFKYIDTLRAIMKMKDFTAEQIGFTIGHSVTNAVVASAVSPTINRVAASWLV